MLHDNGPLQMAVVTKTYLDLFAWDILNHFTYSSDLAPSDFHIFLSLNIYMGSEQFPTDKEKKQGVLNQKKKNDGTILWRGIKNLIPRLTVNIKQESDYL